MVEIPDDGNDYEAAAGYDTKPLPDLTKTVGSISTDEFEVRRARGADGGEAADGEKRRSPPPR